jgi:RsiW-degrading membrane proteinase PrsW (M82 family)
VSAATQASIRQLGGSGAIAILATLVGLSVLGTIGLANDLSVPLGVVPPMRVAVTVAVWAVYAVLLLVFFVRPARRAQVLLAGAVLAFAWGGLAATDIAGRANSAVVSIISSAAPDSDGTWGNVFVNPAIEETVKTLGILLLLLLPAARRMSPVAGLVLGAMVGVSFQVVENVIFTLQGMFNGQVEAILVLLENLFTRGLVGLFSHLVYSGVIGAAIGWALTSTAGTGRRLGVAVLAIVLMVVLHSWSNWTSHLGEGGLYLVSMGLGLAALVVTAWLASRATAPADPATPT